MHDEALIAGRLIREGKTILYPTDTIWGIGCDATQAAAVARVFDIKRRPDHKSMLVLVRDEEMLAEYLNRIPDAALEILQNAVRPTTIIYPGARNLAPGLIAPDGSVGIRICGDPFCQALLRATGKALVSTSANYSGESSPSNFAGIDTALHMEVDYVCKWRREESAPAKASSILKIDAGDGVTVIRA